MELKAFASVKNNDLKFILHGKKDSGEEITSSMGNRDLTGIKDIQDQWFLGLAWLCSATPRVKEICISDKTIVDIANTTPLDAALTKLLGNKQAFKTFTEFMKGKKLTFVEPSQNLALMVYKEPQETIVVEKPEVKELPKAETTKKSLKPKAPPVPKKE